MRQIIVDEFNGTTTVNIPQNVAYISIEGYSGVPTYHYEDITDSFLYSVIENANYNTIVLNSENFRTSQFPLIITTFSESEMLKGLPLFDRPFGIPFGVMRLAVGKRNEECKNITYKVFADYVNEGGSAYVTKDFGGLDYDVARQNLDVYSKQEIDRLTQEYEYTNITFNRTRNDALRFGDTHTGYPFIQTPQTQSSRINCHNTLHSYYKKGVCGFELKFRDVKTYADLRMNPCYFTDIQGIFNGHQFTTQAPIIIKPTVQKSDGNIPGYFRRGYLMDTTVELTNAIKNDVSQYPVMVITPDYQIRFANTILEANSVYFIDLNWNYIIGGTSSTRKPTGISWYDSSEDMDTVKYDFNYVCTFVPNDPQLN